MAVAIRLSRGGSKKRPYYRIVVADERAPRDGHFIERIGSYNPLLAKDDAARIVLDTERAKHWLGVGAQPTDRVARFLDAAGVRERAARSNLKKGEPGEKAKERAGEQAKRVADAAEAAAAAAALPPVEEVVEEAPVEAVAVEEPVVEEAAAEETPVAEPAIEAVPEEAPAAEAVVEEAAPEPVTAEEAPSVEEPAAEASPAEETGAEAALGNSPPENVTKLAADAVGAAAYVPVADFPATADEAPNSGESADAPAEGADVEEDATKA